jgi:hypothetical protein
VVGVVVGFGVVVVGPVVVGPVVVPVGGVSGFEVVGAGGPTSTISFSGR